jgi:hypothetical protein
MTLIKCNLFLGQFAESKNWNENEFRAKGATNSCIVPLTTVILITTVKCII